MCVKCMRCLDFATIDAFEMLAEHSDRSVVFKDVAEVRTHATYDSRSAILHTQQKSVSFGIVD